MSIHPRRLLGIAFGLGTQALFLVTVVKLFFFLRDGTSRVSTSFLWADLAAAIQFAVIHSVLLHPSVRKRLRSWIPPAFYGCFFCTVTCVSLLLAMQLWRSDGRPLVAAEGWLADALRFGFYASWVALFYSLWISGLGYQTGWTPWWHWFRGIPLPRREFQERGAYRFLRHPIYLSFLGLIWFTPYVTIDRALLTGLWTLYIAVGSYLKDERLAATVGEAYRDYQRRVPGFPLLGFGPWGRLKSKPAQPRGTKSSKPAEPPQDAGHRRVA